jgi:hypothetical protein
VNQSDSAALASARSQHDATGHNTRGGVFPATTALHLKGSACMQQRRHLRSTRRHEIQDDTSTNVRLQLQISYLAMQAAMTTPLDP